MDNLWRDQDARGLEGIDLLVYRSRLIGRETRLVVWGGGNTSIKLQETDFRGRKTRVMRIKGSGSDLKTIEPKHFPGIRLDDLDPLRERPSMSDDEMVAYLVNCLMETGSPRPSIETLLHGFVPHAHIDHTHADAILGLTNTANGRRHVEAVYKDEAVWIPYRRPGFELSREIALRTASMSAFSCFRVSGLLSKPTGSKRTTAVKPIVRGFNPRHIDRMKPARPMTAKPMQAPLHKRAASGASSS